jgi:hypothetical protein
VTARFALVIVAVFGLLGCTSQHRPELPPSSDTAAIADRITGPDGQAFLREITTAAWDHDGREAAELFAWIPGDATSANQASASRAGTTAHAIASFLADNRQALIGAPANSALWQAFSQSLVPYLYAMVGDSAGTRGFEPLDDVDSAMKRTTSLFATMTKDPAANRSFTEAAAASAGKNEAAFAKAAVADPVKPAEHAVQALFQAARLRALVDAGKYLADPKSPRPSPEHAQTEVMYQIASLTARPDDPHINSEFFKDGHLLSPNEIAPSDWSIYDAQLTVYLVAYPETGEMVRAFGQAYDRIAD